VEIYTLLLKFSHAFLRVATRIITSIARAATHPAAPVSPLERTKILYCPSVRLLHDKKISSAPMALSKTNTQTTACKGQFSKYLCILPDTLSDCECLGYSLLERFAPTFKLLLTRSYIINNTTTMILPVPASERLAGAACHVLQEELLPILLATRSRFLLAHPCGHTVSQQKSEWKGS